MITFNDFMTNVTSIYVICITVLFAVLILSAIGYFLVWTGKLMIDQRNFLDVNKDKTICCQIYVDGQKVVGASQTYRTNKDGKVRFGNNSIWVDVDIKDRVD